MLTGIGGTVMTKDGIKPPSSVFKQSVEALIAAGIIAEAMAALRSNSANAGFMRGLTFMVSALLRQEEALMHILAPKAPRLLEAVAQAMAVHKAAVGVQANVCAIFSNLSTDVEKFDLTSALLERAMDEARAAVRPVCAAMLAHPGAENVQRSGSRALQFFGEADLGKAVAAAGGAQLLTRILKAGPRPGREVGFGLKKQVIADEVFGRTTMALAELTESRDFVQAFVVAGGVPAVLARINVNEPPVRCASLCTVLEHVALGLDSRNARRCCRSCGPSSQKSSSSSKRSMCASATWSARLTWWAVCRRGRLYHRQRKRTADCWASARPVQSAECGRTSRWAAPAARAISSWT